MFLGRNGLLLQVAKIYGVSETWLQFNIQYKFIIKAGYVASLQAKLNYPKHGSNIASYLDQICLRYILIYINA